MTKSISEIVEQRKQFVSRTYNFLNQHQDILDELRVSIINEMSEDLQNESEAMKKWIEQSNNLDKFNKQMKDWLVNQGSQGQLSQKRILEINYLRQYYEQQIENSKKHYAISLSNLARKKKLWRTEASEYMKRTINLNSDYKSLRKEVDDYLPLLKQYTENWNKDTVDNLKLLTCDLKHLIKFSEKLLEEISFAISTETVDMTSKSAHINQISAQKNSIVIRHCEELSVMLQNIAQKHNFESLTKKLKLNFMTIKDFFLDSIYDSSGSGMRASLRIIKKMSQTEQKIRDLLVKLKEMDEMFSPEYESLSERRNKMISMCIVSAQLEESTVYRWIDVNFENIFSPIDEKIKRLKEGEK